MKDPNAIISERVRLLRGHRRLTIAELAGRSGVSRSMISLIERGEANPSATVLANLAAAFGVPMAALFDEPGPKAATPLARTGEQVEWRDPASGYVRRVISPAGFRAPFVITEVTLPAGRQVAFENPYMRPDAAPVQHVWVLAGTVEVGCGGERYRLGTGDCLAMKLDAPTSFSNPTRRPARYAVVMSTAFEESSR